MLLYVDRESLVRFEVESLLEFVVDNAERIASRARLDPLGLDELQATTRTLEQVVAGVG